MNIFGYIIEHSVELIAVAGGIVSAASLICAMTPTPTDDAWCKKLYTVVEWLALNVGKAKK